MINILSTYSTANKKFLAITVLLVLLLNASAHIALGKNIAGDSVEITMKVGDHSINKGETAEAIIIINNNTPFEISVDIKSPETKLLPPKGGRFEKRLKVA